MNNWRIISRNGEAFSDRMEAGKLLAAELLIYRGKNAVVLGIPRGGLAVAQEIANQLEADLDIVLSRKLRSPGQPELAFGAISENGQVSLNQDVVRMLDISSDYIERESAFQLAEINRRKQIFRQARPKVSLTGRVTMITDDGVATGATFKVALAAARQENPSKLIAALPVGPEDTIKSLAENADELICLQSPSDFRAVGQFYQHFEQLDDETVLSILHQENERSLKVHRG